MVKRSAEKSTLKKRHMVWPPERGLTQWGKQELFQFILIIFLNIDQRFGIHMIYRFIPILHAQKPLAKKQLFTLNFAFYPCLKSFHPSQNSFRPIEG